MIESSHVKVRKKLHLVDSCVANALHGTFLDQWFDLVKAK